jgi:phosphopentomutase
MGNCYLIVIDGLGVGAQEDSHLYGDQDANTLGHVCEVTDCRLPAFQKLGLGNIIPLNSVSINDAPLAASGKMREISPGKDSTTGHWELAGVQLEQAFPTYPNGFPEEVIRQFLAKTGSEKALCNRPISGTEVIELFGEEHLRSGNPIVYTSSDSVFQVACHDSVTPLEQLYEWCSRAREEILIGDHQVGRVIARPFTGEPGSFVRLNSDRKDFSARPPENNLLTRLQEHGVKTYSIGKVVDLFAGIGFTQYRKTKSNAEGISQLLSLMSAAENSFIFVNLIDTDQLYGHRLDPEGYARCLEEIDRAIPALVSKLREGDVLIITGDHGNDPTAKSTDHSREFVPLLVFPLDAAESTDLGIRNGFFDVAKSVSGFFGLHNNLPGKTFLNI